MFDLSSSSSISSGKESSLPLIAKAGRSRPEGLEDPLAKGHLHSVSTHRVLLAERQKAARWLAYGAGSSRVSRSVKESMVYPLRANLSDFDVEIRRSIALALKTLITQDIDISLKESLVGPLINRLEHPGEDEQVKTTCKEALGLLRELNIQPDLKTEIDQALAQGA
ncbi:MAG: hypothetical protein HQ596_08325 [Candidatus Saganbacteria bacterium]|nr:hypothetical protein [Candidatus Saganbacteria bacterium]